MSEKKIPRDDAPELFAARICKGIPSDCCDYAVVSLSEGVEVCRVWTEDNARRIASLLNRRPDHRSFPDAADGRPLPPMGDELMTAGLSGEDARFVAIQLAQNGMKLCRADQPARVGADQIADTLAGFFHEPRGQLLSAAHAIAALLPTEAGVEPVAWVDEQELRYLEMVTGNNSWGNVQRSIKVGGEKEGRAPLYTTPPAAQDDAERVAEAASVLLSDNEACLRFAEGFDREDAAQRGEPSPHIIGGEDYAAFAADRISCVKAGLRALGGRT